MKSHNTYYCVESKHNIMVVNNGWDSLILIIFLYENYSTEIIIIFIFHEN